MEKKYVRVNVRDDSSLEFPHINRLLSFGKDITGTVFTASEIAQEYLTAQKMIVLGAEQYEMLKAKIAPDDRAERLRIAEGKIERLERICETLQQTGKE